MSKQLTPLQKHYNETVAPALVASRGYKNKHQVPKLVKITLNSGIDADADKNQIAVMLKILLPKAEPKSADAADALAIAITHAHHRGGIALRLKVASL